LTECFSHHQGESMVAEVFSRNSLVSDNSLSFIQEPTEKRPLWFWFRVDFHRLHV